MTEVSGRLRLVAPVAQLRVPEGVWASAFRTQTLVGVLPGFGTASGAPKRQPTLVQLRLLPVCVEVVAPSMAVCPVHWVIELMAKPRSGTANGSGTELPP